MGVIKTALEIALEKTENVKGDKSSIDQFEGKQRGKRLANAYLEKDTDLALEIKKIPAEIKKSVKQGIFDVFVSQITLPVGKDDERRLERALNGLAVVVENKQINTLSQRLIRIISSYQQEAALCEQAAGQQYAPRLRQKEEELSRRLGREVRIDPSQDPEYSAFYNQRASALKANYEPVIERARAEAHQLFNED